MAINRLFSLKHRSSTLVAALLLAAASGNALAAKGIPAIYSDVAIAFGGQVYGFSGPQQSFVQTQDGGRIVLELTTLGTPANFPVTQIDSGTLDAAGNQWDVVTRIGNKNYTFSGICSSETFSSKESGVTVRHLFLSCQDLTSSATGR